MGKRAAAELWIKLTLPGVGQIGPGKVERRRVATRLFARPLVAKWQGGKSQGGASLTPFGEKLVASFATLRERSNDANRTLLAEIGRSAARPRRPKRG
jgi:hypothetical protein